MSGLGEQVSVKVGEGWLRERGVGRERAAWLARLVAQTHGIELTVEGEGGPRWYVAQRELPPERVEKLLEALELEPDWLDTHIRLLPRSGAEVLRKVAVPADAFAPERLADATEWVQRPAAYALGIWVALTDDLHEVGWYSLEGEYLGRPGGLDRVLLDLPFDQVDNTVRAIAFHSPDRTRLVVGLDQALAYAIAEGVDGSPAAIARWFEDWYADRFGVRAKVVEENLPPHWEVQAPTGITIHLPFPGRLAPVLLGDLADHRIASVVGPPPAELDGWRRGERPQRVVSYELTVPVGGRQVFVEP